MVMDPPEGVVSRTLSRDGQWENHTDVGHLPLKIDDVHGRAPARP